jgi:hypothetical protein
MTTPELLGVSHLVLSVREPSASWPILESLGYGVHEANESCPHPAEKAPFLSGQLYDTGAMRLMVPANEPPAIEVLRSSQASAVRPHFGVVLSEGPGAESEEIRNLLSGDREKAEAGHLDGVGVVCLSLFCRDADHLRATLSDRGYEAGDCFTSIPFGTPLRIFFMRNVTGEIYELLSNAYARGSEGGP